MRVLFISNFFNHHQKYLSDALYIRLKQQFAFIATEDIPHERKSLGYHDSFNEPYLKDVDSFEKELSLADIIISGSAPEDMIRKALKQDKVVFRYYERPLKKGNESWKYLPRLVKWHCRNPFWRRIYLLCASAYTAGDYHKYGLFCGKALKWGYFPETKKYDDIQSLINKKKSNSILWVGRFLDWKHPEDAIRTAICLQENGYSFELNLIGNGEQKEILEKMIEDNNLNNQVHLLGSMSPENVRAYMEQSQIFLLTSDRQEGWGAVLNEAMNSGCAVIASHAIGSVPYLLKNGKNGIVYASGNIDELYQNTRKLLDKSDLMKSLGKEAYLTIEKEWNAEIAAERLIKITETLLQGKNPCDLYHSGPCSTAYIIDESWYQSC